MTAIDCKAGLSPFVITTQQDADSLLDCVDPSLERKGYTRDVVISPSASGPLNITAYSYIDGTLTAENNSLLEELYLWPQNSGCCRGTERITIRNLTRLTTFVYASLYDAFQTVLRDLPSLEKLSLNGPGFRFANDLELVNLPRVREITVPDYRGITANRLVIRNVGVDSLDPFFFSGPGSRDNATNWTIEGNPNVKTIDNGLRDGPDTLHIAGTGNLSMVFNCTQCEYWQNAALRRFHYPHLQISGLSSLSRTYKGLGAVANLTVGTFSAVNNTLLTSLPILFDNLTTLHIENNPLLEQVLFSPVSNAYNWTDIFFSGNPKLRITSDISTDERQGFGAPVGSPDIPMLPRFYWPSRDVSSMVFDGHFDNGFFDPYINLGSAASAGSRPRVRNKFVVRSAVEGFDCRGLNELRKGGVLKGEYSCQGQTVADESKDSRAGVVQGSRAGFLAVGVVMVWGLFGVGIL